jgi:hypothetical protein
MPHIELSPVLTERPAPETTVRPGQQRELPTWALPTLIVFCLLQLALLVCLRTVSGLSHLHTVQEINLGDLSAGTAAAACTEGLGAADDFWPAISLLNIGRIVPLATARAWGQVPLLVEAARQTCPSIQLYAKVAPSLDRSLDSGIAADLLDTLRRDRDQLVGANAELANAFEQLQALDLDALSADARLARFGRAVTTLRQQQADVSDALAATSPETLQNLLGGGGPRAVVLNVDDAAQAYLLLDEGKLTTVGLDDPRAPPVVIVSVDQTGLADLRASLPNAVIPDDVHDNVIAQSLLASIAHRPLIDNENVAAVLKHAADDHHAWFWFEDPRLQELVTRRGWVRQ